MRVFEFHAASASLASVLYPAADCTSIWIDVGLARAHRCRAYPNVAFQDAKDVAAERFLKIVAPLRHELRDLQPEEIVVDGFFYAILSVVKRHLHFHLHAHQHTLPPAAFAGMNANFRLDLEILEKQEDADIAHRGLFWSVPGAGSRNATSRGRRHSDWPASSTRISPVIFSFSRRKRTASPTSSGRTSVCNGLMALTRSKSSPDCCPLGSTMPGATPHTRIRGAKSSADIRTIPMSAYLVSEYEK